MGKIIYVDTENEPGATSRKGVSALWIGDKVQALCGILMT